MNRVIGNDIRAIDSAPQTTAESTNFSNEPSTPEVNAGEEMDNLSYFEKLANNND
jgi:hypothetical protein